MIPFRSSVAALALVSAPALAQDHAGHDTPPAPFPEPAPAPPPGDHSGHDMPGMDESEEPDIPCITGTRIILPAEGSGTARLPGNEGPMKGLHIMSEASAFRGAEPDEARWNIETPKLDSWSVRATLTPSPSWALQASYGQLKQPEALHPGEDEHRFTASAHYASGSGLSAMLAFSAKDRVPGETFTAWLAEANWNLDNHNTLFGRFENVANNELFPDHSDPLHDETFRVSKFQLGYARRVPLGPFELALGGSLSTYAKPTALDAAYGSKLWGDTLFAKLTLGH